MSKPVKDVITREYQSRYGELNGACVVNVIGLDAIASNRLRNELKAKNIRVQVLRNRLARRALSSQTLGPLASALKGPCAIVTGGESIIDVAKTLVAMKKTYPKLELKLGMVEGDPDLIDVEQMAKLKSRIEVLGDVAMLIASPGRRLAGCLQSPGGRIAGCLKAIVEKADKAEEPAEAGEPPASTAETAEPAAS
jgi:large subunit ribosomal protein L10